MKKILLIVMLLLAGTMMMAQQAKNRGGKGYLFVTGGPSFPIASYGTADPNNSEAGGANTGYIIGLQGGYTTKEGFGIAAQAFFGSHAVDPALAEGVQGITMTRYKMSGFTFGPLFTWKAARKLNLDFSIQSGAFLARSPELTYQGTTVVSSDEGFAFPFLAQTNLRVNLGHNMQFFTGLNYLYAQPKFNVTVMGSTQEARQKMQILNLMAGIGIGF